MSVPLTAMMVLLVAASAAPPPEHAVILLYHHVDTETPASTSTSPTDFAAHLDWLAENGFTIRPLTEIVAALRGAEKLPDRTVALTFDDGYRSIHARAFPLLRARKIPFTVFVCPEAVDTGRGPVLTWDQLREMATFGATVANHSNSHGHLQRRLADENETAWLARVRTELVAAQARIAAEMGAAPALFAYPYGEYDDGLRRLVVQLGWTGFGQQSGAVGPRSDFGVLPRYPLAGPYASLERFGEKMLSLPLPVVDVKPSSPVLAATDPAAGSPQLRLTLDTVAGDWSRVTAYAAGRPARVAWEDRAAGRLLVAAEPCLDSGRSRYNVTSPSAWPGRWYWYSHLWIVGEEHED